MVIMFELDLLFPKTPPAALAMRHGRPACEWVMPAPAARRRDFASVCKRFPPGMPDCLRVTTVRSEQGSERCAAAIYGKHAYVIHYAFMPAEGSKAG